VGCESVGEEPKQDGAAGREDARTEVCPRRSIDEMGETTSCSMKSVEIAAADVVVVAGGSGELARHTHSAPRISQSCFAPVRYRHGLQKGLSSSTDLPDSSWTMALFQSE
jgi:hypothetical protein